jgi:hypothetical protein
MKDITEALKETFEEEALKEWIKKPNPAFQNKIPQEMIEVGDVEPLWEMLLSFQDFS